MADPAAPPEEAGQEHPGFVVVSLNQLGVAVAFGPYDERQAHEVAELAVRLARTWMIDLGRDDRGAVSGSEYGLDDHGLYRLFPEGTVMNARLEPQVHVTGCTCAFSSDDPRCRLASIGKQGSDDG